METIESQPVSEPLAESGRAENEFRVATAIIVAAALSLFLIRVTGYPDLARHDERVSAYVLDAVQNGNWLVQKDSTGEVASKPPLLTWCAAGATLLTGHISRQALYFPAAASLGSTALILLAAGRQRFGWRAGFLAGLAYLLSPAGFTQLAVARYDSMLALFAILAALAAFRAWTTGGGWTWFWLAAAAGTLAKGPLAVGLGAAGLLAAFWERRNGTPTPFRGSHLSGVVVFLLITGGWFALAYGQMGQPLVDKMIGRELIGHAVGSADEPSPSPVAALKPPVDFVLSFAPWSLLALCAFWRVWWRPDPNLTNRRFERFLLCGFLVGLLIFCLAGHQKSRLIVPLIPFAALLAGRELAERTRAWSHRTLLRTAILLVLLAGVGVGLHAHFLLRDNQSVRETQGSLQMARLIAQRLGGDAPVTFLDSPFAVQFYLNRVRPQVSFERAAALLRGDAAAYVVVCDLARLEKTLGAGTKPMHEVLRWPATGEAWIRVVGNHPPSASNQSVAQLLGPVRVETQSLQMEVPRLGYRRGMTLSFRGDMARGKLRIENQGDTPQLVKARIFETTSTTAATEVGFCLQPGVAWDFPPFDLNPGPHAPFIP